MRRLGWIRARRTLKGSAHQSCRDRGRQEHKSEQARKKPFSISGHVLTVAKGSAIRSQVPWKRESRPKWSATRFESHETRIRWIQETFSPAFNAAPPLHFFLSATSTAWCCATAVCSGRTRSIVQCRASQQAIAGVAPATITERDWGRPSGAICYDYDFPAINAAR